MVWPGSSLRRLVVVKAPSGRAEERKMMLSLGTRCDRFSIKLIEVLLVLGGIAIATGSQAENEIRVWVDAAGVTHFSSDPEAVPGASVQEQGIETLRAVWQDGLIGSRPVSSGESSFGNDRVDRLLRGALADLERSEVARADSTLRGVLRIDPHRPEAHWYLAYLAGARGRFTTAEHHLTVFLDVAGAGFSVWRERAKVRLSAIRDERQLADPDSLDGPLELERIRDEFFNVQVDARLGEVADGYADQVLGFLGEARSDVSLSIGVAPDEPLGVVLYGRAAYTRAHAHRFTFQTVGFFDGQIHVSSPAHPSQSLRGLLFHEYTHAVFREHTGGDRPYWLNEGFAEQVEREARGLTVSTRSERAALRTNIELGNWIPLESIAHSFGGLDDEDARYAYLESVVTVAFIHSKTDVEGRRRLLRRLGEGLSIDQALHEVMGVDTESLDQAVQAEIRAEFPEWTVPAALGEAEASASLFEQLDFP
jgi:hypothetical protein